MPDEPQGNELVEETQPAAVPTAEQTPEETGLPEDASERTKEQFAKLTEHNKKLAEELELLKAQGPQTDTSVFDSFRPQAPTNVPQAPTPFQFPGLTQNQINDTLQGLFDKDGFVDGEILKNTLSDLQRQVKEANEKAAISNQRYEQLQETRQVKEVHSKYPQLDPKNVSVFDKKFFEKVKKEMIVQKLTNGEMDFMAAADEIAEDYPLKKPEAPIDTQKKQDQVRQINATGSSASRSSAPDYSHADEEDLIRRTRAGDTSALMERLNRVGK